ncbi:putative ribonuclease H-like domain-containing protein [Tanacetum coccineum]
MKKMYCLVVTENYSRFSWVFFLATKDETSEILKTFWAKAVNTAYYVQNRVLVIKPHNKTPYELFLGRKPTLSFMRPFGCLVTILNTLDHLGKFDGKADEGFFVRYSTNSKAYRVFNSRTRIVEENHTPNIAGNGPNWLFDIDALTIYMNYKPVVTGNQTNGNAGTKENIDASQDGKKIVLDQKYILLPLLTSDPSLSKRSKDSPDAGFKPSGEEEKMEFEHLENENSKVPNTEEPRVNQEHDANVNNTNNINTVSPTVNAADIENNVIVYSDDDEEVGVEADMNNLATTMPVSPIPTTRVHKDHPLEQIIGDIHSAPQTRRMKKNVTEHKVEPKKVWTLVELPYGKRAIGTKWVYKNKKDDRGIVVRNKARLVAQGYTQEEDGCEEEVYVCQPPGFEDLEFPNKVYKVAKALYGLHQAPSAWCETLSTYLLENRFRRGTIDKTLFIKKNKGDILLVKVYVDDIIFGSTKKYLCTEFEQMMHKRFQMSSMGEITFFLGLQVKQKDDGIFISQDKYVVDILKKFDFATVKIAITPMEANKALLKDEEAANVDVHLYRLMIRSLMYLTASRPDIMFVVCACTRFQVTPKTSHLHVVKRIFRYLKGHPKLGLWYPRDSPFDLEAFSDSDYAVANSTTEAEYVVAANCYGHVLWIQNQLLDYGYNFMNIKIFMDNESTICIVKHLVFHSKTKYIEIRHHFIKDSYEKRLIQVIKIHTDHNVADLLKKAFDVSRFQHLIARCLEWNGTAAKDEVQVSAVRVTYYWQVYLMLLVAFNTIVKIKNVEPIKQKWVKDETVIKEWEDIMERAATTASSLEAEQDSGAKIPYWGVQKLKFDLRLHLNKSYDPPLLRVNTLGSGEDTMKLKELMEFCTKLSVRALDL